MAQSACKAPPFLAPLGLVCLTACAGDAAPAPEQAMTDALFVAHEGVLVSYDLSSGEQRAGELASVVGPVDLQALEDGRMLVNLSRRNEVLIVDGRRMLELARLPSSALGAIGPVHGYVSPWRNGNRYWLALNDGSDTAGSSSAVFVDIAAGSATFHTRVGEVTVGRGHHEASFSAALERVVVSNGGDCEDVLSVFDYSDVSKIARLATLSAEQAGWDGSSFAKTCDPTYTTGVPPAPQGCASSALSGRVYCNLSNSGQIAVIGVDADPPTFEFIETAGGAGGYTRAAPGGRYVFSLSGEPREVSDVRPGRPCQIGQLAVIDAASDALAAEVPLFYDGPGCTRALAGTDEETAEPAELVIRESRLYVTLAGASMVTAARVRRQLVLDISDPAWPVQLDSIAIGESTGRHGTALSADGERLFVANNLDGTVTEIHPADGSVVRTLTVRASPVALATWQQQGPSRQTGPIE